MSPYAVYSPVREPPRGECCADYWRVASPWYLELRQIVREQHWWYMALFSERAPT